MTSNFLKEKIAVKYLAPVVFGILAVGLIIAGGIFYSVIFRQIPGLTFIKYIILFITAGLAGAMTSVVIIRIKELKSKIRPTVKETANLVAMMAYKNIRQFSSIPFIAGSMVGGVNEDGTTELYTVEPAGTVTLVEDFDANFSSGMPYILGLLERLYKKDLSVKEGVELAVEALKASTQRDIASGNGIDVFAITKDGVKHEIEQEIASEYKERK